MRGISVLDAGQSLEWVRAATLSRVLLRLAAANAPGRRPTLDQSIVQGVPTGLRIILPFSTQSRLVNLWVTGPMITKFLCNIEESLPCHVLRLRCDPPIHCGMPVQLIRARYAYFRRFAPKLVTIATSHERSENEYQTDIPTHMSINPENLVKISPVDSEIIGLILDN